VLAVTGPASWGDLRLEIKDTNTNTNTSIVVFDHAQYTRPPSCHNNSFYPPVVWLDDRHLLTIVDGDSTMLQKMRGMGDYHVVSVDIVKKTTRVIETVHQGYWSILPPSGDHGDVVLLGADDTSSVVASVDAIVSGGGKFDSRPAHWGHFTVFGIVYANSSSEISSIHVGKLLLGNKVLADSADVTVSPDGTRVIWRSTTGEINLCDSQSGQILLLGQSHLLGIPVWITPNDNSHIRSSGNVLYQ